MAALSSYLKDNIIDHFLRNQAFTPPTTVYLALFTAVTGLADDNPTAEVSGGDYARLECALDAASGGVTANTSDLTSPIATASWGTITHVALVDHLTNTTWGTNVHVLAYAALDTPREITATDLLKIDAGDLDLTLT